MMNNGDVEIRVTMKVPWLKDVLCYTYKIDRHTADDTFSPNRYNGNNQAIEERNEKRELLVGMISNQISKSLLDACAQKCDDIEVHDHECYCGTSYIGGKHETGHDGCVRYMTDPPDLTDGTTMYTYKYQRGYHQHPCGCWSRWPGSINSLEDPEERE